MRLRGAQVPICAADRSAYLCERSDHHRMVVALRPACDVAHSAYRFNGMTDQAADFDAKAIAAAP